MGKWLRACIFTLTVMFFAMSIVISLYYSLHSISSALLGVTPISLYVLYREVVKVPLFEIVFEESDIYEPRLVVFHV